MPHIIINVFNDDQIQACATVNDGEGYIGISIGALKVFNLIINRMLCSKEVFPKKGEAAEEIALPFLKSAQVTSYRELVGQDIEFKLPINPERAKVAASIIDYAIRHLILHEYAHLLKGHCLYEFPPEYPEINKNADRQFFEIDADQFAMDLWLELLLERKEKIDLHSESFMWSFAVFSIFNFIYLKNQNSEFMSTDHPPDTLRFRHTLGWFIDVVIKDHKDFEELKITIEDGAEYSAKSFDKIQIEPVETPYSEINRGEHIKHFVEIVKRKKLINKKLKPFSFY